MNKRHLFGLLAFITIFSLALTGCASTASNQPGKLEFVDDLGRTITLDGTPKAIVSLAPSNTELLYAIGAGPQMVGRDAFSDYPAEAAQLTSIGGSMGKFSMEDIAALKPDLVILAEINTPEQVKSLEDLNITAYYLANPTDIDGMYINLEKVGKLTGHEKEASDLITSLKKRVEAVQAIEKSDQPVKVFYEVDSTDIAKPWTVGKGTFADTLLTMAGGENIGAAACR